MSSQTLVITGQLPGLNEITDACRGNANQGGRMKKEWTNVVAWAASGQRLTMAEGKVNLICTWYEPNRRRDPDNIHSGLKFILDGLVWAGVLIGDGQKHIGEIRHNPIQVDAKNPRVEIRLEAAE